MNFVWKHTNAKMKNTNAKNIYGKNKKHNHKEQQCEEQ